MEDRGPCSERLRDAAHQPSFPRAPYRYSNREHLIITYHTDRAELVS